MLLKKSKKKAYSRFVKFLIVFLIFCIIANFCSCKVKNVNKIYSLVIENAEVYSIEADLLLSIINTESSFNEKAISNKGACGLMQLMPSTAIFIAEKHGYSGVIDLFDPKCNLDLACKYLLYLKEKFQTLELVLCAYNAGEGRVREWLSNSLYSKDGLTLNEIPFKETKEYLQKVISGRKFFKAYLKSKGYYEKGKE